MNWSAAGARAGMEVEVDTERGPMASPWNATTLDLADITMDRSFFLLVAALCVAVSWVVYMSYYNSRLLGFLLTRLINKFYFQDDNFKIGSITLNALSGKIMFRDIVYITYDYTLRIQDGYLIFRWWRSYIPKDVSEDLSHSDTRLSIVLNGFELHVYNRSDLYAELERTFGLEPCMRGGCGGGGLGGGDPPPGADQAMNDANEKRRRRRAQEAAVTEAALARTWRDLIPVIKADVCSARVVFGNRLVPTTLSVSVEEAHLVYSTKPPASSLDHLMHFVKAKADNCKVLLAPSPNYTAMVDEPPRYMGEGFVVMSSNYVEVYFYMDEPGLVPERPVLLQLANGDVVESAPPIWGVDIKCGKGTDFSYGPWADRQRDHLFKFFFPPDYKNLEVTPQPKPGDRRQMQSFDIRLSTLNEATIDILFTKNKETNAVHINIGAGSYLEMTLPWIVLQDGYTTKITGQLLHLEATTSLQYRSLAESETLEYTVKCHYPLAWNHHQCWQLSLTGCKATAHFVYTHIEFFQDLVNDWASKARPDILHFVPYTWKISLLLKECEVVTVSNQYNWIDCSSTNQENNHVAFCGDLLDVSFDLPFIDFLPDVIPLKIWVQGEAVDMSLYLPDVNTSRLLLLSLDKNMKLVPCRFKASKWRRKCVKSQGWVDCWSVPIIALSVRYTYHPIPPLGPEPQADITTPEKEEILLSPMRIPRMRKQPQMNWANDGTKFDRTALPPDKVSVELEVGPSIMLAYGTIITSFMNLLENIFGEDQSFTDMQKTPNLDAYYWQGENGGKLGGGPPAGVQEASEESSESETFDTRRARPLDVTVSITLHDIQAHLVKNCSENEPPCPIVLIERFGFEMDKSFRETKLQLLLSPSILVSANNLSRTNPNNSGALYQGHLMLSSLQLRGHGFFSDAERTIEEDTIEYAWMMELQLGQLTGRLTLPQMYQIVSSLETFFLLVCDDENELSPPNPAKLCHHGLIDVQCPETDLTHKYRCPTPNEIKYRMVRVAVDLVDLYVADGNTALQTWVSPARLTFCNLHGAGAAAGLAALLPAVRLALYTQTNMQATGSAAHHHSGSSVGSQSKITDNDTWLGVGTLAFGPVLIEANEALPQTPKNLHLVQHRFIKLHDEKTRRLWFLWPNTGKNGMCGCVGGCAFFGSNRNGPGFLKPCGTDLAEGVNVASFHVIEGAPGEFGFGQSLLHPGQLVFHTPPYGRHVRLHTPRPDPLSRVPRVSAPAPPAAAPHPARRASYTSAGKPAAAPARSEVPYARLVDSSALLGSGKIDSDSKLNKAVLSVPQLESSVSDSRLALSCALKDGRRSQEPDPFLPRAPARSVAVSESHYSLDSQPPADDRVPPEVRRTMSITSENQSEAFFSADEDMFPSRSSSLKHSFGSRHSNTRERSFGINETASERWTAPAQKKTEAPDSISNLSAGVQPDSESGSVSSTSFISAISSQEDMTLVNLHMQTNKPIVDSPLLMASYMHSLQQYRCSNWGTCSLPSGGDAFTLPLFRRADDGTLVYVGQRYLPNFEPIGKGNVLRLISKKESQTSQSGHGSLPVPNFNSVVRAHPYPASWWDAPQPPDGAEAGSGGAEGAEGEGEPTTTSDSFSGVSIRLRGSVDAVLTPLVLESAQRFVESLTPVLAAVHPATVLTHLRLLCIASVRGANVLKQKRYVLNWLPQMLAREGAAPGAGAGDERCELATIPRTNAYEETVCSRLTATLSVPRVDVLMLQSAVVEDTISFSALDNIQDLTCVSLFGVALEGVCAQVSVSRRAVERVQLYYRPALRALHSKKSFGIMKGARLLGGGARRPPDVGEPVYIESAQHQAEDISFSLNVGKVHGQLRRIRNEASQLKDATITGIPSHNSKVSFTFARLEPCLEETNNSQNGTTENQKENAIGYIMFECGLEGVAIKVSRHSQQKVGEERPAPPPDTPKEADSARASVRSEERDRRSGRTSGFEDLFRKKDSSSKPSTPNLGSAPAPPEPAAEPEAEAEPALTSSPPATVTQPAGNTSSCSIDLKVVWFNFAAPPRTPITRKIDYTRLDWNLLSTAAPAINAWMNPCNRLGIRVVALYRAHARRLAATAACLMAGALDLAPHPAPPKSRYNRHTAMARQLREEPSLQLCGVLLRHALAADAAAVQADLAERHLPSLSTLRQGVIVLSRQWKNILYTPLLLEHGLRNKVLKPLNVTFALPELLEEAEWAAGVDGSGGVVGAATAVSGAGMGAGGSEPDAADENCLLLHSVPHNSEPDETLGMGSEGSVCSGTSGAAHAHSHAAALAGHATRTQRAREDLYQWMAKQEPVHTEPRSRKPMIPMARLNPLAAAAALPACSLYPLQGSLMLLDAHLVFQPLLQATGVCPHQVQRGESKDGSGSDSAAPALESLGSRLALLAWVDTVRVDIVVGELGRDVRRRQNIEHQGTSAFICEKVCLDAELRRVADAAVGEVVARRRVLYISRGQLKRHISTVLNFNLAVRHIEQQVNMPLLRLLHQISSMYQNVKEAQVELRADPARVIEPPPSSSVSDFRENLVSVSSMDGGTQYSTLDSKWELLGAAEEPLPSHTPAPAPVTPTPSADFVTPPPRPPPPAPRARPQSFAQKLRSTGKSVKGKLGYSSLNEGAHTPMFPAPQPAGVLPPLPPVVGGADSLAPRCWRTLYLLLDLYAQMPDADTITHRFSVSTDLPERCRNGRVTRSQSARENSAPNVVAPMGIVVVGVARIHRTRLLASLSGLKLEAEITALQGSLSATRARQWSLTGTIARSTIVLLEGAAPHHATVVRVSVGKSQALHSWEEGRVGRAARGAAVLLSVGGVRVELPQHPVALHGVMTRSSRQLSSTLQELGVGRASSRAAPAPAPAPAPRAPEPDSPPPARPPPPRPPAPAPPPPSAANNPPPDRPLLNSPQLQFSIAVQSLSITAALLPSLQAQYKMEHVSSSGVTGDKAHFTIELPQHSLSFVTKLQASEANIPAAAMVALPAVHVMARVAEATGAAGAAGAAGVTGATGAGPEGAVLRAGRYLAATADIGLFEHTLSTDLLNHLVFVQKVFMKEVNEVVQKVSGGEKPVPLWGEEAAPASPLARALFTLIIRIQRIQLTATTPSNSAVRLETGAVELELSNRVQNVPSAAADDVRLFARAQVDINLSLGQLIRNAMFEEAEPEFQQYAFFNTRISMRNAFQDEMPGAMPGGAGGGGGGGGGAGEAGEGGDVVLIRLKRPLVYIQPVAVDRAILVWLNYKNAYEYWNEKRRSLNTEVLHATQQLIEKVQQQSQLAAPLVTTLFLQLDVDDIGICLPLTPPPLLGGGGGSGENEARGAVVVTLESTSVSACSRGALVSAGRFVGLCLRFADEFEASLDDWKPRDDEPALNVCCVSEGTYEVCSRTTAARHNENAKWFLNVSWQMEGVDIHLDVSVGKQLSALGHTLTMLTGFEEEDPLRMEFDSDLDEEADNSRGSQVNDKHPESLVIRRRGGGSGGGGAENLPAFVFDPHLDARQRSKLIEQEMNEQAKIINDLRALGASHSTIQHEMKRLHDLEALVFKDFRRDMIQKLRRQSVKASSITRGKLGLGSNRSKSFMASDGAASPAPPPLSAPPALLLGALGSLGTLGESRDALLPDARLPDIGELHVPTGPLLELEPESRVLQADVARCWAVDLPGALAARYGVLPDTHLPDIGELSELIVPLLRLEPEVRTSLWPRADAVLAGTRGAGVGAERCVLPDLGALPHSHDTPMLTALLLQLETQNMGPSRSASLRGASGGGGAGTAGGGEGVRRPPPAIQRQSSLPAPREPWLDIDPEVELRRKYDTSECESRGGGGSGGGKSKAAEPNIDFELDVKVHVNSGKCVLHTRDSMREDDRMGMRLRVGRSASGGLDAAGGGSGGGGGSPGARRKVPPASRLMHAPDTTVFRVPGLHLKVHYESKTMSDDGASPGGAAIGNTSAGGMRKGGGKKAALFAWITLQSIPEETIISPHILEFLEYALEPIPIKSFAPPPQHTPTSESAGVPADGTTAEGAGETGAGGSYGQYVYASFPVDVIVHFHMQPSTFRFSCLPASRVECLLQLPSLQIVFSSKRATDEELASAGVAAGGLSVTGCLADFSVYMFHPYGGKKSSVKDASLQWSPLQDQERKDSLSINVEFVKFHLSRSRKLDFHADADSKATVRFSTIVDVGSAWFKYDMRRLGEILAFPKAWYRRTIVRRMFLGDVSAPPSSRHAASAPPRNHHHTPAHGSGNNVPVSPNLPQREKPKTEVGKAKDVCAAWETLVLFAVNFTKLNVHMNMGNVMGNVSWQSRDFTCSGRLSIGSTGHRNMLLGVTLAGSALDARGGIVGGAISLSAIHTYAHISEEPGGMPAHVCGARLAALELRLEYMGTPVLLARVSRLHAAARDEWLARATPRGTGSTGRHRPTARPAIILTHGTLAWAQLQLLMSRSTTPDLLKMQLKLEEFFTQQFKSSKRVFSSLHPDYRGRRAWERREQQAAAATAAAAAANGSEQQSGGELRHHRHWQGVLRQLAGMQLATLSAPLPADGMVLGGTMELHGANVSLACFHGNSFKAKSWALFSLKDPCISFATEAQQLANEAGELEVHVVQSLTAGLGLNAVSGAGGVSSAGHQSMATVCRMTRALLFPPQFKTLREWFHYAFASSEIDAIELFPSLERETGATGPGPTGPTGAPAPTPDPAPRGAARGGESGGGKGGAAEHTREVIFALPSLQLHLRTQHSQAHTPPTEQDPKPVVECSFITEFEDHIFVSVDAEAFLFLHDLISSYIKEKDRVFSMQMPSSSSSSAASGAGGNTTRVREGPPQDYRDYNCITWHLEPTVRLLSWAGKSIEPYGVDYILQKLGFRHARTTIPKWLQRGALDPLDRSLAALLARLANIVPRRQL